MNIAVHRNGEKYGPYTLDQVRDYLGSGALSVDDLAWCEGCAEWSPLKDIIARAVVPPLPTKLPPIPQSYASHPVALPSKVTSGRMWTTAIVASGATLAVLIVLGAFVVLGIAVLRTKTTARPQMIEDDSAKMAASEAAVEDKIATNIRFFLEENRQQIFQEIHPLGTAISLTVHDVKVTKWVGGQPIGLPGRPDVDEFRVHYTIYWSSFSHPGDGVTEINDYYSRDGVHFCFERREIKYTNGTQNSDVATGAVELFNVFLRSKL